MPAAPSEPCPPIRSMSTLVDGVLRSSSPYFVLTTSLSPWNLRGQWHCSQVSRAGRSSRTGEGMGRE